MNLNKVFLIGNLTRDVTLRSTPSGQSVANFGLATNRTWVDTNGQKQQETEFHNIVVWGKMAELCNQYLSKGRMVFVEGRIRTRAWQDTNGQKRWRTEIIAQNIQFGPRPARSEEGLQMPPPKEEEETSDNLPTLEEEPPEEPAEDKVNPDDIPF